jgi:SAM-dependent methyltransferase
MSSPRRPAQRPTSLSPSTDTDCPTNSSRNSRSRTRRFRAAVAFAEGCHANAAPPFSGTSRLLVTQLAVAPLAPTANARGQPRDDLVRLPAVGCRGVSDYGPDTYGDRWASVYDDWVARYAMTSDADLVADRLAELAGGGPALELAVGSGRVALPLAARGIEVHGIDASRAMLARLRAKTHAERIRVTVGDFANVAVEGEYRLIFVIFNTFFALLTQEDQVRCFANVAKHLARDGVFVIEAFVPDVGRFDRGQRVSAIAIETESMHLEASKHDRVTQRVDTLHAVVEDENVRTFPVRIRYAWPAELDLMARLAGLRLRERWGAWDHEPFTAASNAHVSVYEHAADQT